MARPDLGGARPTRFAPARITPNPDAERAGRSLGRAPRRRARLPLRARARRLACDLGLLGGRPGDERNQLDDERAHRDRPADLELPDPRCPEPTAALSHRHPLVARLRDRRDGRLGARRLAAGRPARRVRRPARPAAGARGYTFQGTTSYDFVAWNDAMETLSLVHRRVGARPGRRHPARHRRLSLAQRRADPASDPRHAANAARLRLPHSRRRSVRRRERRRRLRIGGLRAARRGARDHARPAGGAARGDRSGPGVRLDALAAAAQGRAADRAPLLDAGRQSDDPARHGRGGRCGSRRSRRARSRRGHRLLTLGGRPRSRRRARDGPDGHRPRSTEP